MNGLDPAFDKQYIDKFKNIGKEVVENTNGSKWFGGLTKVGASNGSLALTCHGHGLTT